jgi:hypothetical protein
MRSLAILLIFLNLAFFYWHTAHRPPSMPASPVSGHAEPAGLPRLVLLSERERDGDAVSGETRPEVHCETVGPLAERARAEALRSSLENQGVWASVQSASRDVVTLYWVYLAPRSDRAAAVELAGKLTELGIQDLYVVNEGEYRHGVSLGLFSEHERARRRLEQLESLGYEPRIEARLRTQIVYWLDLAVPADRLADLELPSGLSRMERTCQESAQDP